MQNAAFRAVGLDWRYVALEVERDELEATLRRLPGEGFVGANVTAPYKRDVARMVDTDHESVNTLVFDMGWRGLSTDAAILASVAFERAVIVGDGGAAAAFRRALPEARVFARRGEWPPDASGADLVVHATPVRDSVVVDVVQGQTLVDLLYPGSATADAARAAGARVVDGLEVLVAQGAAAFELWTGLPAPVEVMRRAVGLPREPRAGHSR